MLSGNFGYYAKIGDLFRGSLDITERVSQIGLVGVIERYSLKYVNLIQSPSIAEQIKKINMAVRLGEVEACRDHVSIEVHRKEDDIMHLMSIVTGAQGKVGGKNIFGVIVSIDSIFLAHFPDFREFAANLPSKLEKLRIANKMKFFGCLTAETIEQMGPTYD